MKNRYIYVLTLILAVSAANAQLFPDRHTTSPSDGWKSCQEAINPNGESGMSHWIKFDFETVNNLTDIKIWNLNDPAFLGEGVQSMRIDYSMNNTTWTNAGTFTVPQSLGSAFYEGEIIANLNGVPARHMILTAIDNYGGTCVGISEARFYVGQSVPVELTSFAGSCNEGVKKLKWSFGDVSEFESVDIEWSKDGVDWKKVYSTQNQGTVNNSGLFESEWRDAYNRNSDKNFYRLKMNDTRGFSQYSSVEFLSCGISEQDVTIYPQPVSEEMTINIELMSDTDVEFVISDLLGREVTSGTWNAREGLNQFSYDASNLLAGQYFMIFEMGSKRLQKKFIKQ